MRALYLAMLAALTASPAAAAQQAGQSSATVQVKNANGQDAGTVEIKQLAHGTLFVADLKNLPPGEHAFHVHERAACDAPDFKTAGSHYNPQKAEHGFDNPGGPHAGDLPNIYVAKDGTARAELYSTLLSLRPRNGVRSASATKNGSGTSMAGPFPLLDSDGSAIMVHAHADDYRSMDSAGARLACGIISSK
ncbi:MAG: superoxide dismutase family protein [Hyphomicrobiaceae bacterium]